MVDRIGRSLLGITSKILLADSLTPHPSKGEGRRQWGTQSCFIMNSHLSLPTVKILSLALLPTVFTSVAMATPDPVEASTLNSTGTTTLATGSAAGHVEIRPGGLLIARGSTAEGVAPQSPALLSGDNAEGPTMLWHPRKGAFFAGIAKQYVITDQYIGKASAAFGDESAALGECSLVFGLSGYSQGFGSLAGGGYTAAVGDYSAALGVGSSTFGLASVAMGDTTAAVGDGSVALGVVTSAMGGGSTATGVSSEALGTASFSAGYRTVADAYGSFAIGSLNTGGGNPGVWVPADPLFEIGNGDPAGTTPSNAVTVYKNGNVDLNGDVQVEGVITCAPGGDIPMFSAE